MNSTACTFAFSLLIGIALTSDYAFCQAAGANKGSGEKHAKNVRLAVVARQDSSPILNLLDLAQVQLTKEDHLELLERQTINRILKEQKLSLSGVIDASSAVRVGQILATDLFAVLETDDKEAVGIVIYDAATGVKYVDRALPERQLQNQVNRLVESVRTALTKRTRGLQGLKLLGVAAVRNADLPPEKDALCQSLAAILERQLVNAPAVAVLERKRLKMVLDETAIAPKATMQKLVASLFALNLEFSRTKDSQGITVTALLTDGRGRHLKKFRVEGQGSADLLTPLSESIRRHLKIAPPPQPVDRKLEARRFLAESILLRSFEQKDDAYVALYAALALESQNLRAKHAQIEFLSLDANYLLSQARVAGKKRIPLQPKLAQQILATYTRSLAEHLDLLAQYQNKTPNAAYIDVVLPLWARQRHRYNNGSTLTVDAKLLPAEWIEQRDEAHAKYLQIVEKEAHILAELTRRDPSLMRKYSRYLTYHQIYGTGNPAKTKLYTQAMTNFAREWAGVTREPKVLQYLLRNDMLNLYRIWSLQMSQLEKGALKAMVDHPHPLLALDARVYLARTKFVNKAKISIPERVSVFQEAKEHYMQAVKASDKLKDPIQRATLKKQMYLAWRQSIIIWGLGSENYIQEMNRLLEFMLERKDVIPELLTWIRPQSNFLGPTPAKRWQLLAQAVAVVAASERKGELGDLRKTLLQYRDAILKLDPKLAKSNPELAALDAGGDVEFPWRARLLFHVDQAPGLHSLRYPFLHQGQLYSLAIVGSGNKRIGVKRPLVQLLSISLSNGKAKLLSRCPVSGGDSRWYHQLIIKCFCVCGDTVYVGTLQDGIVALPFSGKAGRKVDFGLPSTGVLALTCSGEKLFASLKGGYLLQINPRTKEVTTLASSRRKETQSPFDDAKPFTVPLLTADPKRHRLLFLLLQPSDSVAKRTSGFWEYNLKTRKFTRLLRTYDSISTTQIHPDALRRGITLPDGKLLLTSPFATLEFDTIKNKARLLYCPKNSPVPSMQVETALVRGKPNLVSNPGIIHNNWLWGYETTGLSRLSLNGRVEKFPTLGKGIPRLSRFAGYIMRMQPDELLVGGSEGFAVLKLDAEPDPLAIWGIKAKDEHAYPAGILRMNVSEDGNTVAVVDDKGALHIGPVLGEPHHRLQAHEKKALAVAVSPNGKLVATAGSDGIIKTWEVESGKRQLTLKGHAKPVTHLVWANNGACLASAGMDGTIRLWDGKTGNQLHQVKAARVVALAAVPERPELLSAHEDQVNKRWIICRWNVKKGLEKRVLVQHSEPIYTLAIANQGKLFAWSSRLWTLRRLGKGHHVVHIADLATGKDLHILPGGALDQTLETMAFSHDGSRLGAISANRFWLWDIDSKELLLQSIVGEKSVPAIQFMSDGKHFFTAGHDRVLRLWELPRLQKALRQQEN